MRETSLVHHARLTAFTALVVACAVCGASSPALADDGGNGAVTTRPDSGAQKTNEPEDDGGCRATTARADLGSTFGFAALGAVAVLARGARSRRRRR